MQYISFIKNEFSFTTPGLDYIQHYLYIEIYILLNGMYAMFYNLREL